MGDRAELRVLGRTMQFRGVSPSTNTPLTEALKGPSFLCRPRATRFRSSQSRLNCRCSRGTALRGPVGLSKPFARLLHISRSGRLVRLQQIGTRTPATLARTYLSGKAFEACRGRVVRSHLDSVHTYAAPRRGLPLPSRPSRRLEAILTRRARRGRRLNRCLRLPSS